MITYLLEGWFDSILGLFVSVVCVIVISALLITIPLWIIPYKLLKKKCGAE